MSLAAALALTALVEGYVPGSHYPTAGVRLDAHSEHVTEGAVTRTIEVEDVVANDSPYAVEARYAFRLPSGAALTRVALDVDGAFVDGEVIPERRAESIFRSVVDADVPRDPALVERRPDGSVSVKIYPMPAYGSRRIRLTVLVPEGRAEEGGALAIGKEGFVLRLPFVQGGTAPAPQAIVVDVSHGRSDDAIDREIDAVHRTVSRLSDGAPFVVLACDSACDSFPETGLAKKGEASDVATVAWLRAKKRGGARDVVSAVREASRAIGGRGRITYVGSARATAGVLARDAVAAAVSKIVGPDIAFAAEPIDDDGALASLLDAIAADVALPPGLHAASRRFDGGVLVVVGAASGFAGGEATFKGRSLPLRRVATESAAADALFAQTQIDSLEARGDDESLEHAGRIGRAHRLLASRASWIVLENEAMFREFGVARTKGAARGAAGQPPRAPAPAQATLRGFHVTRAPMIRMGFVEVRGRLPPEKIQHTIRLNHARFRDCYDAGLRADPTLEGRVAVKFVIDRTGNVESAQDGGSDLRDREVVRCMVDVMKDLTFPALDASIVTVVYPFILTPEDGIGAPRAMFQTRVPKPVLTPHDVWQMKQRADVHPRDAMLRAQLGRVLSDAGDSRGAAHVYDELSDLLPERADFHAHAALSYLSTLDFTRSAAHAASALELAGKDAFRTEVHGNSEKGSE
jgi:hypothetical protein